MSIKIRATKNSSALVLYKVIDVILFLLLINHGLLIVVCVSPSGANCTTLLYDKRDYSLVTRIRTEEIIKFIQLDNEREAGTAGTCIKITRWPPKKWVVYANMMTMER